MLRHFPIGILQVPVDGVEVVDDGGAAGVAVRAQVAARLEQLVLHVLLGDLADLPLDLFRLGLEKIAKGHSENSCQSPETAHILFGYFIIFYRFNFRLHLADVALGLPRVGGVVALEQVVDARCR